MLRHCVLHGKNIGYFDSYNPAEQSADDRPKDTLLLLHCSGASHKIFEPFIDKLADRFRILAPDLLGYGASESWPQNEPYHWQYDVDIILHMSRIAQEPVHCLGYSYGGFLALEASLQAPQCFASLMLAEPEAMHILREHEDEALWLETQSMAHRCKELVLNADLRRATATYLKYWGTPLMWLLAPKNFKSQIKNKLHKMVKEFSSQEEEGSQLSDYSAIKTPTLLMAGDKSHAAVRAVVNLLGASLSKSHSESIDDVNHVTLFAEIEHIYPHILTWLDKQRLVKSCATEAQDDLAPDFA